MSQIFISYRRSDTEIAAGRLGKDLRARFGEDAVFRDKESINAGADWTEAIRSAIGRQGLVLVLIGERWLESTNDGSRRIDDPADTHRREISAALDSGCSLIPILVGNIHMPAEAELPEDIRSLTRHNALKLRDDEWEGYDFPRLADEITRRGFQPIDSGFKKFNISAIMALGIGAAAQIFNELSMATKLTPLFWQEWAFSPSCLPPGHAMTLSIDACATLVLRLARWFSEPSPFSPPRTDSKPATEAKPLCYAF